MNVTLKKRGLAIALAMAGLLTLQDAQASLYTFRVVVVGLKGPPALSLNPASINFGSVAVGQTASAGFTLENTGGQAVTGLQYQTSSGYSLSGNCSDTLAAAGTCTETVTFAPTAGQTYSGNFSVGNATLRAAASLTGLGLQMADTLSVGSLSFGNQAVGTSSAAQGVQLSNTGNTALSINQIATTGNFSASQNCGSSLAVEGICSVNVTFTPESINTNTGTLTVTTEAGAQTVSLSGIGQQAILAVSPASLAFGTVLIGQSSASQNFTLTNNGNIAATGLSMAAPTGYSQTNTCGATLAVGASCGVTVTFTPTAQQAYSGNLQVTSKAPAQSVALTGTGGVASFGVSATSLALPDVGPGTSSTASLTVTNNGTAAATPSFATSTGFSASACGSIAPGASCTSTVTFTPTVQQVYTGTLTVSGGGSATRTVSLSSDSRTSAVAAGQWTANTIVLYSPDDTYWLQMQGDCNLVEYHNGTAVWSSATANGASNCFFAVQTDGNLVVYKGTGIPANAVWSSGTGGHTITNTYLQMGNDGIMHMYEGTIGSPVLQYWQN